ncbi:MAG TPA: carboxypeptidase regulatory-like domain-containing protein [Bryobacteraceae bacterium]|nr:carboxypeptidase regulatory-like domain-containing protein [Bryobacteraceae bacterium]
MRTPLTAIAIVSVLCIGADRAQAQATASLRGTVTDSQAAVIPQAVVTLTNTETGASRQSLTSAIGEYQFVQVSPGTYQVTAEKPGFSTASQKGLKLQVNTPATLDLQLNIGQTSELVNVVAETTAVNTVDASIGNAFTQTQIRQLPLLTRNVVELLSLQPGVTPTGEVLGARRDQNNVTLDGVDVNDNQNAGIAGGVNDGQGSNANGATSNPGFNSVLPIPLDSVQEFRVTVGGQGANEGRSSGGQVALITKSGSNDFHGSAYEFNRNTLSAANTWFNNRSGVDRQPLVRNQFGASLGGRAIKDRAFFFFNYERRLDASGTAQERAVPSESLKNGVLTFLASDGSTQTLSPADIKQIDPLGIGLNQGYQNIMKQYPAGNDAPYGADSGLNFTGFRFNAPNRRDDRAYVGKMDFVLDRAARHTLSVRGTLSNATRNLDTALAQFPGQAPASLYLDNSKGISGLYTAVLKPNLINVFNYGFTRQGFEQSGVPGASLTLSNLDALVNYKARGSGRTLPVSNFIDDLTWTKGKHTVTTGMNLRLMRNDRFSYAQSFPDYGFSTNVAVGLGEDIQTDVTKFIQQRSGNPNLALADPASVATAMGLLLGVVDSTTITYQFLRNGTVLPQGSPQRRSFVLHEYEGYVGDSYRMRHDLTLTFGVRYSNSRPPYETSGLQVAPNIGLNQLFAERNFLQARGVPGNAMPNAQISYDLSGPANHQPSWYRPDNNNFAPRFSLAYSPVNPGGLMGRIFGKTGVFRAGAAMVYDRFGSELITQFDQFGSQGLATTLGNQTSYNFTTAPRYNGTPATQPAAPAGGFPYTPPDIAAIVGETLGISPDLRAPYSYLLNASFARELPGKLTMEIGYVGRLSHKLLLEGDIFTPLEHFKDPMSGETWIQSATAVRQLNNSGLTPGAVQANPSLVPTNPFVESMFPALTNFYFPGSASANYFYGIYGVYGGSYLDILHALDRIPSAFNTAPGTCASRTGCYTFFARQGSALPTWMNAGNAEFHGATISIRRAYSSGLAFDFNYTFSHSIDNASAAEGGAGFDGAVIQNVFAPGQFRGSSDFDIRHNINANVIYELPFGRNKKLLSGAPAWMDQIVGGWQVSSIMRYRTGLPTVVQGNYTWNTNYWQNSLGIMTGPVTQKLGIDSNGNPSLFANTNIVNSFADQYPGQTGMRAALRLAPITNFDIAVGKSFKLPWEGHRIQFRAEAFNAFNNVNFIKPSLALHSPSTFGEFTDTMPPRVMQFALRYEF